MEILELIKKELKTKTLKKLGSGGGGCINTGQGYTTDDNRDIFVKSNGKSGVCVTLSVWFLKLKKKKMTGTYFVQIRFLIIKQS